MDKQIENIVKPALESLATRIIANHERAGQRVSGRTAESLKVVIDGDIATLYGRSAFSTTEEGRKSGKIPRGLSEIIKEWAISKGIHIDPIPYKRASSDKWQPKYSPEERGLNSFAGAVAYKIMTEGTSLHRTGGRNDIYSNEITKTTSEVKEELKDYFITKIKRI